MLGAGLLIVFICGLPISFAIGALIGYTIWAIRIKNRRNVKKQRYIITGGVSYIVAQPLSFLAIVFLPIQKLDSFLGWHVPMEGFTGCETVFAVLFAILFTIFVLLLYSYKDSFFRRNINSLMI